MIEKKQFREYLAGVVAGRGAHISYTQALADFPDHNSSHIGQIADLRMLLEARVKDYKLWP